MIQNNLIYKSFCCIAETNTILSITFLIKKNKNKGKERRKEKKKLEHRRDEINNQKDSGLNQRY